MTFKEINNYFHPAGKPFIAIFAAVTVVLFLCGEVYFAVGVIMTAWCAYFFRDPDRVTPVRTGLIVSPADGRVVTVKTEEPPADLGLGDEECTRISIFLNVFDV